MGMKAGRPADVFFIERVPQLPFDQDRDGFVHPGTLDTSLYAPGPPGWRLNFFFAHEIVLLTSTIRVLIRAICRRTALKRDGFAN
jgi:hypothetical protein